MTNRIARMTSAAASVCLFAALLATDHVAGAAEVIDARRYIDRDLADCGLQRAIDQAAGMPFNGSTSGSPVTVKIPAGTFALRRGLVLRDRVRLEGAGMDKTILMPARKARRLELAEDFDGEGNTITLADVPDDLRVGSALLLCRTYERNRDGYNRPAYVTRIDRCSGRVTIETPRGCYKIDKDVGFVVFGTMLAAFGQNAAGRCRGVGVLGRAGHCAGKQEQRKRDRGNGRHRSRRSHGIGSLR